MKTSLQRCLLLLLGLLLLSWESECYFIRVRRQATTTINPEAEIEVTEAPEVEGVPITPAPSSGSSPASTSATEEPVAEVTTGSPAAGSASQSPQAESPGLNNPEQQPNTPANAESPPVDPSSPPTPSTGGPSDPPSPSGNAGPTNAPLEPGAPSENPGLVSQEPPANNQVGPDTAPSSLSDPGLPQNGAQDPANLSNGPADPSAPAEPGVPANPGAAAPPESGNLINPEAPVPPESSNPTEVPLPSEPNNPTNPEAAVTTESINPANPEAPASNAGNANGPLSASLNPDPGQSLPLEPNTPPPLPTKRPPRRKTRPKSDQFPLRPFDPEALSGANAEILRRVPSSLQLPPRGPFSSDGLPRVQLPSGAALDPSGSSANSAGSPPTPVPTSTTTVPTTTTPLPVGEMGGAAERSDLVGLLQGPGAADRVARLARTGRLDSRLARLENKLRLNGAGLTDQERLEQLLENLFPDGVLRDRLVLTVRDAFSPRRKPVGTRG